MQVVSLSGPCRPFQFPPLSTKLLLAGALVALLAACGGVTPDPLVNAAGTTASTATAVVTIPSATAPAVNAPAPAVVAPVLPPPVTTPTPGVTTATTTPTLTLSVTAPTVPPVATATIPPSASALPASYRGSITFDTEFANGSADVLWTRFEELPDLSSYVPSGTARITLTPALCDPVSIVVPIFATQPNGPGSTLVVRNTDAVAAFQKAYNFSLDVDRVSVTFSCRQSATNNTRVTQVIPATIVVFGGSCTPLSVAQTIAEFARYTEPTQLKGSQVCLPLQQRSASWDFRAQ